MREKYPGEMTIILQHQFWDLSVTEQNFEVGLSFNNIPERLLIPFDAVTGFFDPSVQFGLKFEVQEVAPEAGANDTAPLEAAPRTGGAKGPRAAKTPEKAPARAAGAEPSGSRSAPKASPGSKTSRAAESSETPADAETTTKVVSIDAFRKKP
jgi:hypothetical protein